MKASELNAILLNYAYATEDVKLCREEGDMSICDTKLGVISMSYDEKTGIFTAFDNSTREGHILQAAEAQMIAFISEQYIVDEVEIEEEELTAGEAATTEVVKIDLHTELKGDFKFEKHFNSTADFYQALQNFESNNWELLGETSYTVHLKFADDAVSQEKVEGMNASAYLAAYFDEELAGEIDKVIRGH